MAESTKGSLKCVDGLRFVGRSTGLFKALRGFNKTRHTIPDGVNSTTQAFLAKLCAEELAEEMEGFFKACREGMGYKRAGISVETTSPVSVLTAKDFTFEIEFGFDGTDSERVSTQRSLHSVADLAFLRSEPCAAVFGSQFTEIVFSLVKGTPVETVIDAVEALKDSPLSVDYPSDCAHCLLSVEGVDAQVRFTGSELVMVFPKAGAPGELLEAFLEVQQAFVLSKNKSLAALIR